MDWLASPENNPMTTDSVRWLEGLVVLDLTRYLAGPVATRLLTELGATVIKIEQPPFGDPNRSNRPRINRRAGAHIQQNRGKQSVCVDLDTQEGQEIVRSIAAKCDIVVENFSPGVLNRKHLGYNDLKLVKPDIIMASISGFGQTGPLAERPCFDLIAQAYSGIMHMTGEPDGPPTFVGTGLADSNAGVHAFAAIGHALFHRSRTGKGCHLDIAMVDSIFHYHEQSVHGASMEPDTYTPMRAGRHYPYLCPAGSFRGPQGWIVMLCTEWQMSNLWNALNRPELAADPRFDSNPHRVENREALTTIIEDWMASFPTDEEVMKVLEQHRVPHGPTLSPADALKHPHFVERGVIRTVQDPLAGAIQIPGFPFRSTEEFPERELIAPALGEHNASVLQGLLGFTAEQISDLKTRGILDDKPH